MVVFRKFLLVASSTWSHFTYHKRLPRRGKRGTGQYVILPYAQRNGFVTRTPSYDLSVIQVFGVDRVAPQHSGRRNMAASQ